MSLFIISSIVILTFSCTRTSRLIINKPESKTIAEFNYLGKNRNGYIELSSENTVISKWLKLQNDTLKYVPLNSDSIEFISMDQIKFVYFKDHLISFIDGILIGFFNGLPTGFLFYDPDPKMSGLITFGFGVGGSAIGAIVGSIKGSKLLYSFNKGNYSRIEKQK